MPRRKACTWIIGMLVVLMSIGAIGSLILFAMRRAYESSQQQQCAQNLKRLGEACQMYQTDWHDVLVPYGAPFAWPPNGRMWPELLDPYIQTISPRSRYVACGFPKCPSAKPEEEDPMDMHYYGMNERCGGWYEKCRPITVQLRSAKYPSRTIRIAESMWKSQGGSFFAARPSEFEPGDPTCHLFPERHMGKGNVLWIDGHVSSMTQAQYNMRDRGPYDGNVWLRLEGPKPPVPGERM